MHEIIYNFFAVIVIFYKIHNADLTFSLRHD